MADLEQITKFLYGTVSCTVNSRWITQITHLFYKQ